MGKAQNIWFVYRSHYEGPLSKRVRSLSASSILEWFRAKIETARGSEEPSKVVREELGGYVYGFDTIFEAAREHRLPIPQSTAALGELLHEHLYVEGKPDNIRLDDHTLRVRTDDDEVDLAYFFFDDTAAREYSDRVAYLLQEDPRLPDGDADGTFRLPVKLNLLLPGGEGKGATYACLLTFYDSQSIPGEAAVFPGVRLPDLAAHLRRVLPESKPQKWSAEWLATWPLELRLLRAMVDPNDRTLSPALGRAQAFPLGPIAADTNHSRLGIGAQAAARDEFLEAAAKSKKSKHAGDPKRSIVHEGEHVAVLCAHTSSHFGYQQWILFDDRWAAAHPDLASSVLRYASGWDPFILNEAEPAAL
jgi:hypothetical protein